MSGDVVDLALARWERKARAIDAQATPLALVVQAEPGAVRVIVGDEETGCELSLSPLQAEDLAHTLLRTAASARCTRG